ncbi:MAG: O-antigen ligase family protein [Patescibacteria group bacterium]
MNLLKLCNRVIEYSFYAIFLFIPLVLAGDTSELFEFNKMWVAFGLGIVITAAWIVKSIISGRLEIQRTPLDIPIGLFLLSQIMSTIFSLDHHVSIWGYYSRFNGGLLSTILYIVLYYAFVSNVLLKENNENNFLNFKAVKKILNISLISGLIVGLWGLPSHFGYDPTCFLFRGQLDVSCWADDFQPKIRIFSTLGQPDWLAAYMGILIPINIALIINNLKDSLGKKLKLGIVSLDLPSKIKPVTIFYILTLALFYTNLLYSGSRSGILAVWLAVAMLLIGYYFLHGRKTVKLFAPVLILTIIAVFAFSIGTPFGFLNKFTYGGLKSALNPPKPAGKVQESAKPAPQHTGELGGTDSGKIRLLVWTGAINAWKDNPLFGTGVETFAFAYYKYKPAGQNLTSEWNFLYNKAHNEFLNYLATSGLFGLGSYLAIIGYFFYLSLRKLLREKDNPNGLLILGFLASLVTILITNFFGFSVVIVNIYFFLIPAFAFAVLRLIDSDKIFSFPKTAPQASNTHRLSPFQWISSAAVVLIGLYLIYNLFVFWNADKAYAYGNNLDRVGYYQQAFPYLQKAVAQRPGEPLFRDELSVNNAILAAQILSSPDIKDSTTAAQEAQALSQQALAMSGQIVSSYPNNFVFWKTRVRIFYTLSQVDPNMLIQALDAVKRAQALAPNDASINFNLGVIEGQTGNIDGAIMALERTIQMKPDYRDARYALGLFYNQKAYDKDGKTVIDRSFLEKAKEQMRYILSHISSGDAQTKQALEMLEKK